MLDVVTSFTKLYSVRAAANVQCLKNLVSGLIFNKFVGVKSRRREGKNIRGIAKKSTTGHARHPNELRAVRSHVSA